MLGLEEEIDQVIAASIGRHSKADLAALARAILEDLWEACYDVTRQPDMIPIRRNPGENAASPYTAEQKCADQVERDLFDSRSVSPTKRRIIGTHCAYPTLKG
jgi:hypothetical protein